MSAYSAMDTQALKKLHAKLLEDLKDHQRNQLSLDLSRGKPAADQLDLSQGLNDVINKTNSPYLTRNGSDVRNYGVLEGIEEARALGAMIMDCSSEQVICWNNSSLTLMNIVIDIAYGLGLWGDHRKWSTNSRPKMLTPVPGYDRHFTLTERVGLAMVNVSMDDNGPNMEEIRALVANDSSVKGIWCIPRFSNPTGCTYSTACVEFMAELPNIAAADDFVVLWDNAYAMHGLTFPMESLSPILQIAKKYKTVDHIVSFASTSKITYPGAGIAFMASGPTLLKEVTKYLSTLSIGPDKLNQLRHALFLEDRLEEHMKEHALLLKPKFELVTNILEEELGQFDIAKWTKPKGGYFISLDTIPGIAKQVGSLANSAGLTITPPGATFPYGYDPNDCNLRIAPTYAEIDELESAVKLLSLCIKLAAVEKKLGTVPNE
tara:strand:- start:131 stop:1429 length:1299 start_codon:yes stop_codon:yes gene_type:complete